LQTYELGVRFRHALIRDAALAELSANERGERSRHALAAVMAARPNLPDDLIEVAADLAEIAGERAAAVDLLLESARRALVDGALTSAESAQRRALALAGEGPSRWTVAAALVTTLGPAGWTTPCRSVRKCLPGSPTSPTPTEPGGSRCISR
jgi:hypothetical protein